MTAAAAVDYVLQLATGEERDPLPMYRRGDLMTSARVLVDALAALDEARQARDAAAKRWAEAMKTVQLAQEAAALDMPPGSEPVTLRISATHVATLERAGRRAVKLTRSRVLSGRA